MIAPVMCSKEAAAMLGFALLLGTDVREDLLELAGSLSGTGC